MSERLSDKLLPCPFCGLIPVQTHTWFRHPFVGCLLDGSVFSAIRWNLRKGNADIYSIYPFLDSCTDLEKQDSEKRLWTKGIIKTGEPIPKIIRDALVAFELMLRKGNQPTKYDTAVKLLYQFSKKAQREIAENNVKVGTDTIANDIWVRFNNAIELFEETIQIMERIPEQEKRI